MGLRSKQRVTTAPQRFEANDVLTFEDALASALEVLEEQGIQSIDGDPDVTIILRNNGKVTSDGDKLLDAIIYIAHTNADIAVDINKIV